MVSRLALSLSTSHLALAATLPLPAFLQKQSQLAEMFGGGTDSGKTRATRRVTMPGARMIDLDRDAL